MDKTCNAWVAEMVSLMMVKDKTGFRGYLGDFSFLGNRVSAPLSYPLLWLCYSILVQ